MVTSCLDNRSRMSRSTRIKSVMGADWSMDCADASDPESNFGMILKTSQRRGNSADAPKA